MMIPLLNSRCEIEPTISLTAAMSTLRWGVAFRLDRDPAANEGGGVDGHKIDASVCTGTRPADLVKFGDCIKKLPHERFEFISVEIEQVLHRIETGDGVKLVGVGQIVPRVVDDRLHGQALFRSAGYLRMQVGQAVEWLNPGEVKLVEVFPWDLNADQAPVCGLAGGRVDRVDISVARDGPREAAPVGDED